MIHENNIPGYKIDEVLHEGKRTIIYRAIRTVDKKNVLLKTLANPYPGSTEIAYLKKEYALLKSLDIKGTVRVYDLISYKGKPIIVQEDIDGISLAEYIASAKISLEEFLKISIKIADSLGALHALTIMHKNINPQNIIINVKTKEIVLVDFRIAAKLSLERTSARNPHVLEGTLPYISPEQTGRMNRSTDYRTDLYSLGITFYEILLGTLPFSSEEPMELVHCHLAKNITPPAEINSKIPKVLSDIILKLTEKNAENRYQSAGGLKYDLEKCLLHLKSKSHIPDFLIGGKDIYSKFNIREKLYGRDHELSILMYSFKEVSNGGCRLALIRGSSGVGKTALINEIHKPTVNRNGYFVSGKFDQFKANSPFSAFSLAFSELVKDLVSEPSDKLKKFKTELIDVLGLNAPVLIDLVPKFEYIIGKQRPAQPLNPAESKNRFFFTLREFVRVFATQEHPLTIFLDDLQWGDDSSLQLISDLISTNIPYLFIIGSYRDKDIGPGHPLQLTVEKIKKTKQITELTLSNLDESHVNQLISDTLKTKGEETKTLAAIIYKRTAGNPFYVYELFKTTFTQGLLYYDYLSSKWTWNIKKIAELTISSNVVDFMAAKLNELPEECRRLLEISACIGSTFDLKTLSLLAKNDAANTAALLWPALQEEIIIPISEAYQLVVGNEDFGVLYKFHHDRIQQSVYQYIAEDTRKILHLTIGRLLVETLSDGEKSERVIDLVRHFNEGSSLLDDVDEKIKLARMNLQAGQKAQSAVAYVSALNFFRNGIDLLPDSAWESCYRLTFDLYAGYAQNAYQTNDYLTAETCINVLLEKARTKLEKVEVLSFKIRQYNTVGKAEEAIRYGIEGLALLGYYLPEKPASAVVLKEVILAKWRLGTREPVTLLDAPLLRDPEKKAAARLLTEIGPSAYVLGNDSLYGLTQLKIVNLSMQYGNCEESAYAYVAFGAVLSEAFGDLKSAERFGQLGLSLNEKLGDIEYRCRVIAAYGVLTHHFNNHWNTSGDFFKKGIEAGYLSGDLFYLAYCATNCTVWQPSLDLPTSLTEQKKFINVVYDTNYTDAIDSANMNLQLTKNFMGLTETIYSLNDADFNETQCLEQMTQRKYSSGIGMYHIHKASIYLFYGQYQNSYEAVKQADQYVKSLVSLVNLTRLCIISFFASSGYLLYGIDPPKGPLKKRMKKELAKMKKWANYNPANFRHMQYLMEAEVANLDDDFVGATRLYEKAIRLASEHEWQADEAFANELAAKFFSRHGIDTASSGYWKDAYYLFNKWGAQGKIKFLRETYPQLFKTVRNGIAERADLMTADGGETAYALDVDTIVKSSQAISGEIELKSLLGKMMHIIMMNAGAESGILLLNQDDRLLIQASATADDVKTMQNIPVEESNQLPQTIINYVSNLQESVVLYDAASQGKFRNDDYILKNHTKSILCSPIVFLNTLYGIVYLENNISVGAFTEERLKIVSLLSSQMAISIQNAILYSNLENKVQARTVEIQAQRDQTQQALTELKATQARLIQKEKMASLGELTAGIAHEIQNPLNFVNNFAEISSEIVDDLMQEQAKPGRTPQLESTLLTFLKDNLNKIHNHGQRVSNIVKGMLEHSRVGSGEMQPTNLGGLSDEYMYLAYNGLRAKDKAFNCELITYYDSALSEVNVVSQDISRVLLNLFSNAFYAVRERKKQEGDSYQPVVSVRISQTNGFVEIRIADNGMGMSPSVQQKVFQPFFTTKPTGEGTGLGLSLSYDIVTKGHRGGLLVHSREGEGTEFTIQLPTSEERVVV